MPKLNELKEVGRVLSRANEARLKRAAEAINEVLSMLGLDEAERSQNDTYKLLYAAIRKRLIDQSPDYTPYVSLADVYPTWCVWCTNGRYYRADYTIGEDNAVTLGAASEVIPRTVYDAATPADAIGESALEEITPVGPVAELTEAATITEAARATIKIIAPGWGSSGYYSPDVLKRDGPTVFKAGTKMYWNHQTAAEEAARPEGDLSKLAAELATDARWHDDGAQGPGLYATAKVFERYRSDVKDLAPHIGTSIRALGTMRQGEAEGKSGPIVEKLLRAKSVDFVTIPGAGGKIVEMFEAAGNRATAPQTEKENPDMAMTEAEIKTLNEALAVAKAADARAAALAEALTKRDGRDLVGRIIDANTALAAPIKARLKESLANAAVIKDGALDEAATKAVVEAGITAELAYIASVSGGAVRGLGAATTTVVTKEAAALDEALKAEFVALGHTKEAVEAAFAA